MSCGLPCKFGQFANGGAAGALSRALSPARRSGAADAGAAVSAVTATATASAGSASPMADGDLADSDLADFPLALNNASLMTIVRPLLRTIHHQDA